jgi:TIR domain
MQLFISWSGDRSKALAACLRDWLPLVIQSVTPWFSPEDIDKGARWLSELNTQLEKQSVAIVCVTPENANAPWLLFEVGALSKALDASWVCPVLVGIEPTELQGPLAQFQATRTTHEDIRKLLLTVNKRLETPLAEPKLDTIFELLWPKLEKELSAIRNLQKSSPSTHRPTNDILSEVLERVRGLERHVVDLRTEQSQRTEAQLIDLVTRDRELMEIRERSERLRAQFDQVKSEIAALESTMADKTGKVDEEYLVLVAKKEQLQTVLRKLEMDRRQAERMFDRFAHRAR